MRKHLTILTAALAAVMMTACGSGDGIVINGTTAAESGAVAGEISADQAGDTAQAETSKTGGTKIEIVTDETTTAAESLEGQTEPETTEEAGKMIISAETTTAGTTAAATKAANPTTAPTTAAATKAAAPTTAAATYTVKDVSKTMYASASVRVRSGYSTSTDVLGALSAGEKVTVTGEVENGWVRVSYKGQTAYVAKNYLTETAPTTTSSTTGTNNSSNSNNNQTTTSPTTTTNNGTTPGGSTTGGTTTPNGSSTPGSTTTSGGTTAPDGTTTAPTTSSNNNTTSSSSSHSVTGNVTSLDPSGLTIQTSDGQSYQFTWGSDVPALAPGEKVQVQYTTDSSGQKQVTGISR